MIGTIRATLSAVRRKGLAILQAGPRSAHSGDLNYLSVNTIAPARLASAFALSDQGQIDKQAALFELIEEQDSHIYAELAKRRRAVTGLGWHISPPRDASQAEIDRAEELQDMIAGIPRFEDAHYDLTDAIGKGFAALEIDWQTGATWLPRAIHWRPQRLFNTDKDSGELLLVKNGNTEPLRDWGWIVHEHRAKSGYLEQSALFRVLAWTYAYKAYNQQDMQRFLELYGMPFMLGKFPAGQKDQRDALISAMRKFGQEPRGAIPSNMAIQFVESKIGKTADFLNAVRYWENKQSMAILGGTLTSQADGKTSTNALGEVHDKVRREIMLHDVRQIAPTINRQLLLPIAFLNGMFPLERMPQFVYETEEAVDQSQMIDVLAKGADIGMEIDVDWAHQAMQIPRAEKDAKTLGRGQHHRKTKHRPGGKAW